MKPRFLSLLRDVAALGVAGLFVFPLFWWALTSIKPGDAVLDKDRVVFFDFKPTWGNYYLSFGDAAPESFRAGQAVLDTIAVAMMSIVVSVLLGLLAAYALARLEWRGKRAFIAVVFAIRIVPTMALVIPVFVLFHDAGIFDTRWALAVMHGLLNLPLAVLLLKSFLEDVPMEVDEAAMLDGATGWQVFSRIHVPLLKGGLAATAVLCFVFSSTEYLLASTLTLSFKTLPIKLSNLVFASWGPLAALGTASLLPGFAFILLTQRYLVRGLTLGMVK